VVQCRIGENRQHRPCAPVDDLIAEAARTTDLTERIGLYRQAEQMLFSDGGVVPLIPLFVQAQYRLIQPWLTYEPAHFGGEQYDTIQLDAVTKRLERAQ
jgi:ABC-type oligopeptide transport system substrate-binding subunit